MKKENIFMDHIFNLWIRKLFIALRVTEYAVEKDRRRKRTKRKKEKKKRNGV